MVKKPKKKRKHYTTKNSLTQRKGKDWANADRAKRKAKNKKQKENEVTE